MSMKLDSAIVETGTKFRIFPQPRFLKGFDQPETIRVTVPTSEIREGPADDRIYVVDALNKQRYAYPYLPPHQGDKNDPLQPEAETGHFDHLHVDSREFKVAQMYATVRRTLDIWEDYLDHPLAWHFGVHYERLELVPLIHWNNAHSGYGFLEFGFGTNEWGAIDVGKPYCMNFDVLAHELGHSIIFGTVGFPSQHSSTAEYGGHGEAAGDLVALIAALHSNLVVDHLLSHSAGNLFTINELNRIGELDQSRQIRRAFNYEKMSTVSNEEHELSLPLTGAVFDILVEVFQAELVKNNLISQQLADASYHGPSENVDDADIQVQFKSAYRGKATEFKIALFTARDYLGRLLSKTWDSLSPDFFSYANVGLELLKADREITNGEHQGVIRDCFSWREISFPADSFALRTHRVIQLKAASPEDRSGLVLKTATAERTSIPSPKTVRRTNRKGAKQRV